MKLIKVVQDETATCSTMLFREDLTLYDVYEGAIAHYVIVPAIEKRNREIRLPYYFRGKYRFEYACTIESRSMNAKKFNPTILKPWEREWFK